MSESKKNYRVDYLHNQKGAQPHHKECIVREHEKNITEERCDQREGEEIGRRLSCRNIKSKKRCYNHGFAHHPVISKKIHEKNITQDDKQVEYRKMEVIFNNGHVHNFGSSRIV